MKNWNDISNYKRKKRKMDNKHIIVPEPERRRCENYAHFKC